MNPMQSPNVGVGGKDHGYSTIDIAPEIIGVEQAAKLLNCTVMTVRKKAHRGIIPGRKVGRGWVFVRDHLVQWISGCYDFNRLGAPVVESTTPMETTTWQSTKEKKRGGLTTPMALETEYSDLLKPKPRKKPSACMTKY